MAYFDFSKLNLA